MNREGAKAAKFFFFRVPAKEKMPFLALLAS